MILDQTNSLITCLQRPECDLVARELQTQLKSLRVALQEAELEKQADLELHREQRTEIIALRAALEAILYLADKSESLAVRPEIARLARRALARAAILSLGVAA